MLTKPEMDMARKFAWQAMATYIKEGRTIDSTITGLIPTGNLLENLGCFVTFKKDGALRGCIGTIIAHQPLWKDLIERAIHAATQDPRFPPVQAREVGSLHMEISVLTPMTPVETYRDIMIGLHGILLTKGVHQSVFLPQVALEQRWDLTTTLNHLAMKAGLPMDGWQEGCSFEVFQAQIF